MRYDVAVIIVNYNMPEATDALFEYIGRHVEWPHDVYVVDNGSDMVNPSRYTNVPLPDNVQTTNGWLAGLAAADSDSAAMGFDYWAYWLVSTSAELPGDDDKLTALALALAADDNAVIIHPALQPNSGSCWVYMERQGDTLRQVHHADHVAMLVRADWFNGIGRLDPALIMAHGTCLETCYKARREGCTVWIHDGVQVIKRQDLGYDMGRMRMAAADRRALARANMDAVLIPRYGPDYWERLQNEYREVDHV